MEDIFLKLLGKFSKGKINFIAILRMRRGCFTVQIFKTSSPSCSSFLFSPLQFLPVTFFPSMTQCDPFCLYTYFHDLYIIQLITLFKLCCMRLTLFKDRKLVLCGLMSLSRIFGKIILKWYFEISFGDYEYNSVPVLLGTISQLLVGLLQKSIYVICKKSTQAFCPVSQ